MDINTIGSYVSESTSQTKSAKSSKATANTEAKENVKGLDNSEAVVVETNNKTQKKATYSSKVDSKTITRLKKEAEERSNQLRSLVEKLMMRQSKTYTSATDIFSLLRDGKLEVDDATRAQALKDIAVDGYWGVEQTSERLFSFAKALAGDDPSKADEMVDAFKKGYAAAEKTWGGKLPDICQQTYDAFLKKIDDWKSSKSNAVETEE